ncbi:MAG TPA: lysophospholipid acyltransferase family protein, partial [Beijerinckiaceae bacterium]|nr:lysophospholipid acyltransferase family protein [Beijerinckiaceae bacterium]
MFKAIWRSPQVQEALGAALAAYLRFVKRTNRLILPTPDPYEAFAGQEPAILAMWHGQHFMIPLGLREGQRFSVLISRHGDGELNAIAVRRLGIGLVRGSGAQRLDQVRKRGGVKALLDMLATLERGENMALTADVPKISRVCGRGIITLAQKSGRPILAVAVVCSRRIDFARSWDRSSIGLPFGTTALVIGEPIRVAADAEAGQLERARLAVEAELDR